MDGFKAAASVIAVIQLSTEAVTFINTATGATKERKRLREEIRACEDILQQIRDEADDSDAATASDSQNRWSATIAALEAPGAPLGRLAATLSALQTKLKAKQDGGLAGIITRLKWPFSEKEVEKIIAAIEREKSLLSLALANYSRKVIEEIRKTSTENQEHLVEIIDLMKKDSEVNSLKLDGLRIDVEQVKKSSYSRKAESSTELADTNQLCCPARRFHSPSTRGHRSMVP